MILVVDDHEDTAEVFTRLLRVRGYPARHVAGGTEALAFIRAHPPEQPLLVVLDQMMPDLSGMDTLKAIRRDPKIATANVVFYTAGFDTLRRDEAMTLGALAWMFKGQADPDVVIREVTHIYEKVGGAKPAAPQPAQSSRSSQKSPPSIV
jgi:two-component system phosphate regulon response regulator PhoB